MRIRHLVLLGVGLAFPPFSGPAGAQTLEELTLAALERSPMIAGADARADAADAELDFARAQRLPDFTLQAQVGVGRIDPEGFFGLSADNVVPRVGQVSAEVPLLTFGRIGGGIAQAQAGARAAELMAKQARLALRVELAQAYTEAVAARRLAASYDLLALALTETVRHAELRFRAGDAASTEVAQARARLAEAEAGKAGADGRVKAALAALSSLSGIDAIVPEPILPPPPSTPHTREDAIAMALADNPQLLAAREMLEAAEGKQQTARAERLPMVGAFAEASSVRDQFFPDYAADSVSAGVRLKWTFFSGRAAAKERSALSERDAAIADLDLARRRTQQAAMTAYDNIETARLMLDAAEARETAAKEALRGTKLEVEAGAKTQLALLDAQREAIDAEAGLIEAQGRLVIAAYYLKAVAGME